MTTPQVSIRPCQRQWPRRALKGDLHRFRHVLHRLSIRLRTSISPLGFVSPCNLLLQLFGHEQVPLQPCWRHLICHLLNYNPHLVFRSLLRFLKCHILRTATVRLLRERHLRDHHQLLRLITLQARCLLPLIITIHHLLHHRLTQRPKANSNLTCLV